jgi:hypothetical protein
VFWSVLQRQWCNFWWPFWWLFVVDFSAFRCDALQMGRPLEVNEINRLMRVFAADCNSVQNGKILTQNPPRATSWGFDPPSRHQTYGFRINEIRRPFYFVPKLCPSAKCGSPMMLCVSSLQRSSTDSNGPSKGEGDSIRLTLSYSSR